MEIKFNLESEKERETVYNVIRNYAGYPSVSFKDTPAPVQPKPEPVEQPTQPTVQPAQVAAQPAQVAAQPAQVAAQQPVAQPTVAQAVQAAQPNPNTCPITDQSSLVKYMMSSYQELGAEKGAGIQTILAGMGFEHMNQVTEDKYAELYNQVEALKV